MAGLPLGLVWLIMIAATWALVALLVFAAWEALGALL